MSLSGSALCTAASTASAAAWPCPTPASGETPMTMSAKCRPPAWRIRRRRSCTLGSSLAIAARAASSASAGTRSMSTSMFRFMRRPAATRTSIATRSAADRIALQPACAGQQETGEDGGRAHHVAREMERVRGERRALVAGARPSRDRRPARVDGDDDEDDDERVPRRVDVRLGGADEHRQGAVRDVEAREHEDRGLAERGQVLGLAVPVGMPAVGGAAGDADREEREKRGDEVGAGVDRLGDQAEAAGREPGAELERDQRAGSGNRDERSTPLRDSCPKATRKRRTLTIASRFLTCR